MRPFQFEICELVGRVESDDNAIGRCLACQVKVLLKLEAGRVNAGGVVR
jgi:hypothetical protein